MSIVFTPIGIIHSPFREKGQVPRLGDVAEPSQAVLEVYEEYAEGIADLKGGDMAYILFHFDRSQGYDLTTLSRKTMRMMGVFSTRSPRRPNGIGLSIVRFINKERNRLTFTGVDMLDGTPVLDIKPYDPDAQPRV